MIEDIDRDLFKKCMPYFEKAPVVFDIGAHEGRYTKFVIETIPNADCYLFEPNINLAGKLNEYPHVYAMAVCDSVGYKSFFVPPKANDELSSLFSREVFKQTGFESKDVPCTSIDSFWLLNRIFKIDYMKVDVEGAEFDVLKGCKYMLSNKNIKFIQVEYGGTYKDAHITFNDIISFSKHFGYRVYELINNILTEVTEENFIEDYRYQNFLLTYLPC